MTSPQDTWRVGPGARLRSAAVIVVASFIFLVEIALALANTFWQYRSARRAQGAV